MERTKKAWTNILLLASTLMVNFMGAMGMINNLSQKEISDMYHTMITPSPFTFSIWSLIYVSLTASLIALLLKKDEPYYQRAVDEISKLFWISSLLNIAWIVAFSYVLIELSAIFIFGLFISIALICKKLLDIREGKKWLLPFSFGIYGGWLIIATVVNVSAVLVKNQWKGLGIGSEIWTVIVLVAAIVLVIITVVSNKNAVFALPVAWAYFGIYKELSNIINTGAGYGVMFIVLISGISILVGVSLFIFYKNKYSLVPEAIR